MNAARGRSRAPACDQAGGVQALARSWVGDAVQGREHRGPVGDGELRPWRVSCIVQAAASYPRPQRRMTSPPGARPAGAAPKDATRNPCPGTITPSPAPGAPRRPDDDDKPPRAQRPEQPVGRAAAAAARPAAARAGRAARRRPAPARTSRRSAATGASAPSGFFRGPGGRGVRPGAVAVVGRRGGAASGRSPASTSCSRTSRRWSPASAPTSRSEGPGLRYHLPSPIEAVEKVSVTSLNRIDVGGGAAARRCPKRA